MRIKQFKKIVTRKIKFILDPLIEFSRDSRLRIRSKYTSYLEKNPVRSNYILYEAYHGKSISGNCYAIFLGLMKDSTFKDLHHVWVINDFNDPMIAELKQKTSNISFVKVDSNEYLKYLATSKYLVNDTSFPFYFIKRDEQVYINTWHGTPLKTLGKDLNKRSMSGHKNIQRNLLHCDYLISPNTFTYEKLLKSNDVFGIFTGKIANIGYPRVDLTLNTSSESVKERLDLPFNKKIVLYAPTWRGTIGAEEDTCYTLHSEVVKIQQALGDDYLVLLKSHYFSYKFFKQSGLEHLCVPNWIDTNELLSAIDILITDYSSIFFDFLPLKRPVFFYMPDLREYESERGFYLDITKLPGPICESIVDLIDSLGQLNSLNNFNKQFEKQYKEFLDEYCSYDDGNATDRLIDIIFKKKNQDDLIKVESDKQKLLFYCGGFYNNGITVSATNLFDQIDYNKYEVVVIDNSNYHKDKWMNIQKLHPNVHIIYRPGFVNRTLIETYKQNLIFRRGIYNNKMLKYTPVNSYKRELKRIIGNTKFDVGIDFGGYNKFWTLLFAFGDFKVKSIFLHADMMKEYNKKVNHKYKHRGNLKVIFSLYKFFDRIVSVAESTNIENHLNLSPYIPNALEKMVFVNNVISPNKVLQMKENKEIIEFNNERYLITYQNDKNESIGLNLSGIPLPNKEYINFITIGRLSPEKGQKKLISAFSQLHKHYPKAVLYIVGEGPLKKELKDHTKKLHLEHCVFFVGQLENPFSLLDECDCFVLSSDYEGQGLVLMEAMILKKPIIATDVTGVHSVLEGGYGLLVDNNETALFNGMSDFIQNSMEQKSFDYEKYNSEALDLFYKNVCTKTN
ncbi:glycosyltransferase [Bacillus safensis]|uniref:glycosyltransferase n=2 Tax=Bacillus safensis TaxID=561879 RepID=UPI0005561FED|nr:glycosyltransferase [Bacillus safensis]MED0864255.1 glycosyltransferase [Bacillus safensis]MED1458359.1 glycosyltransferase [Bacillus safensis]PGC65172.1 spore coat protein CotS [Bacillus safensis]PLT40090.1 spore coat protein CotS [Bacillus safensis]